MLEVRNVTAGYGEVTALRDVSISCAAGSVVALLGPNGAGKTTLLRTIGGILQPTSGQIFLDGEDVTKVCTHKLARRDMCLVPDGRGIFPSLTLRDNLTLFSPKGKAKTKEAFEKATASFPILGKRLNQTAGSLSGGEQQMLAIVRAYISNPKIVLVDEASMGLAPLVVDQLFEFLDHISKHQETALLIVEQYVTRALALAESVYLMNHGQVVFSGKSDQLSGEEIFERYLGIEV